MARTMSATVDKVRPQFCDDKVRWLFDVSGGEHCGGVINSTRCGMFDVWIRWRFSAQNTTASVTNLAQRAQLRPFYSSVPTSFASLLALLPLRRSRHVRLYAQGYAYCFSRWLRQCFQHHQSRRRQPLVGYVVQLVLFLHCANSHDVSLAHCLTYASPSGRIQWLNPKIPSYGPVTTTRPRRPSKSCMFFFLLVFFASSQTERLFF